jgi:hypothetical protein
MVIMAAAVEQHPSAISSLVKEMRESPTRDGIIELAENVNFAANPNVPHGGLQVLHVHHVDGDRLECLRQVAKQHKACGDNIAHAVWQHFSKTEETTSWTFGADRLVQDGAIDLEAAKAITEIALDKMIPKFFAAYNTEGSQRIDEVDIISTDDKLEDPWCDVVTSVSLAATVMVISAGFFLSLAGEGPDF